MPSFKTLVGALALFGAAASAMPYESSTPAKTTTENTSIHSSSGVHCKAPYKPAACTGLLCTLNIPIISGQGNANACCQQDQDNSLNVNVINCAAVLA